MKIIAKEFNVHNSLMIRQGKNTPLYFILLGVDPTTIVKFKINYKIKIILHLNLMMWPIYVNIWI